ncbi:MAG: sulfotransferase, partial [Gammaproteobacteria bacterium]
MTGSDVVVTIDPGDSSGQRQMAFADVKRVILTNLDIANYAAAASVASQLADQLPGEVWPQLVAAESLYMCQRIEPAFRYIDRALKIDPRSIASLVVRSRLCLFAGMHDEAIRSIDAAIAIAPANSRLRVEKGELLADAGNVDAARGAFLESVELDPRNVAGLEGLSRLPGDSFSDGLIERVESLIQSGQLPPEDQATAHFSLAHVYDRRADAAGHFAHLNAGNDLKNRTLNYDAREATRDARATIEFFSKEFFARHRDTPGNPAKIIFIVGFPRSGSTLVEQILSSHPSVSAAGEVFALRHAIRDYQQSNDLSVGYPGWLDTLPEAAFELIADDYLGKVRQFHRSEFMTDKLLDNYRFIGIIHLIFPNAVIVNV